MPSILLFLFCFSLSLKASDHLSPTYIKKDASPTTQGELHRAIHGTIIWLDLIAGQVAIRTQSGEDTITIEPETSILKEIGFRELNKAQKITVFITPGSSGKTALSLIQHESGFQNTIDSMQH